MRWGWVASHHIHSKSDRHLMAGGKAKSIHPHHRFRFLSQPVSHLRNAQLAHETFDGIINPTVQFCRKRHVNLHRTVASDCLDSLLPLFFKDGVEDCNTHTVQVCAVGEFADDGSDGQQAKLSIRWVVSTNAAAVNNPSMNRPSPCLLLYIHGKSQNLVGGLAFGVAIKIETLLAKHEVCVLFPSMACQLFTDAFNRRASIWALR